MSNELTKRDLGIDLFKAISIFAVILIHVHPFSDFDAATRTTPEIVVNQLSRFGVPFFFMITGYYFAHKLSNTQTPFLLLKQRIQHFLKLFTVWSLIYLSLSLDVLSIQEHGYLKISYWKLHALFEHPIATIFQGTATHLWFLPAVISSLSVIFALYRIHLKWILPISTLLFVFGIVGGSYSGSAIGITLPFDTRDGPFMGTLFVALGFVFRIRGVPKVNILTAILLMAIGLIGQVGEAFILQQRTQIDPTQIDYVFSTLPFALGIFFFAFSIHINQSFLLTRIGRYTLGIYLIHELFVELLRPTSAILPAWLFAGIVPLLVLFMSYGSVRLLQRLRYLQPMFA